ncbi:MAG: hypothetical protein Q9163_004434 [Psora crenata]
MPKRSHGFNGVPSKRREAVSDQNTEKESRSNNSRDYSYVNNDELPNPTAILATTSGALQRLANIAQYFESSFNHDVNVVEGEEKEKSQKQIKVKRAEIEAGNKKKFQELEEHKAELAATNENLKMLLSAAKGKLETKKTRYTRERKTLEGENKKIYLELKQYGELPAKSLTPPKPYPQNISRCCQNGP